MAGLLSTTLLRVLSWGCLKGHLSFPAFLVVGSWAAKRSLVSSLST